VRSILLDMSTLLPCQVVDYFGLDSLLMEKCDRATNLWDVWEVMLQILHCIYKQYCTHKCLVFHMSYFLNWRTISALPEWCAFSLQLLKRWRAERILSKSSSMTYCGDATRRSMTCKKELHLVIFIDVLTRLGRNLCPNQNIRIWRNILNKLMENRLEQNNWRDI
jgi:hypothetical protein